MCFIPHTFYGKKRRLVSECDVICTTFYEKGYTLTLRQLFYQLVSTNRIANTVKEYERLGVTVTEARYAGLLDWEHIADRVRVLHDTLRWTDAKDRLAHAAQTLRIDTLKKQKYRPEVWIEKDALIELAENVCTLWDVPYIAVKAYSSTSALWEARKRFLGYLNDGQLPLILHLGDHDCTGVDCSRFLQERMSLLTNHNVELRRLALNSDQVEKYELPPQPGKTRDPRFKGYHNKYKTEHVWELDALAPDVIERIIYDGIADVIDTDVRGVYVDKQTEYSQTIETIADNYELIAALTGDGETNRDRRRRRSYQTGVYPDLR
jgi:hypothetical protein